MKDVESLQKQVPGPRSPVPSLAVEIAGIMFAHPVLSPPGPLGFGREVQAVTDLRSFAGFITKSVTLEPRTGHPYPQIVRTDAGWLNALGLPNHGLAAFLAKDLPFLRTLGIPIIVSIAAESESEFVTVAQWLDQEDGVAAIEANVSCPNVADGMAFGVNPAATHRLVSALRAATVRPLLVKLTPNVTDIVTIARAAEDAGADALSVINTLLGLAIDVSSRRPALGAVTGGLSGPAIRPVAVRMVWEVSRACRIPVVGMGGIATAGDALEFIIAGATAVAVGSAAIDRPTVAAEIRAGLEAYLLEQGIPDIRRVIGSLEIPVNGES
jgi:dihydroorotate dehydrogenase (NAD+) catalytic subunit